LCWNIPTDWTCCTGILLLTEYFVLEYSICGLEFSYWLNILYQNIMY
jgi:hypothetical protein